MSSGLKVSPKNGNGKEPNGEISGEERRRPRCPLREPAIFPADLIRVPLCAGAAMWPGAEARWATANGATVSAAQRTTYRQEFARAIFLYAFRGRGRPRHTCSSKFTDMRIQLAWAEGGNWKTTPRSSFCFSVADRSRSAKAILRGCPGVRS